MNVHRPHVKHRDYQLDFLAAFVSACPEFSLQNMVVHGYKSTGKTHTLREYFRVNPQILNCWLEPIELVTWKPFLQHIARTVSQTLKTAFPGIRCEDQDALEAEDFYLLAKFLHNTLSNYDSLSQATSLFIVLDGFDKLQELDSELLPKFIKLSEMLPVGLKVQIKFIHVINDTTFVERYSTYDIPTVVFSRYTLEEITDILLGAKTRELVENKNLVERVGSFGAPDPERACREIVEDYVKLVVQTFHSYTGNDIVALVDMLELKWDTYVESVTPENMNDTLALYRSNLQLFRTTGDTLTGEDEEEGCTQQQQQQQHGAKTGQHATTAYELSTLSKYLLISAYLCSYLEPRYDSKMFSKKSHLRAGRSSYGRRSKMETNPRYLQPSLFQVERMLAIFQAIFPLDVEEPSNVALLKHRSAVRANVEVFENLAELNTLNLITTAGSKNVDYLNYKVKWKVNVPWEIMTEIAATVGFDIAEYFTGLHE